MSDDDRRRRFRLPPFRLPEFFPPDFELVLPVPGRVGGRTVGTEWVLAIALLVDVIDALLALTIAGPALLARSFAVVVLTVAIASGFGVLSVWELVAVLTGAPVLTAFPSTTVLFVLRARYRGGSA
ncbi:hypothetical protein [Halanaeroarchaeum sulfurireducens]|uniref:hypothetical protein n=1 Tax=Halanaeroarchaeum sulfurireducens TaxID=1604004 RepID=UPI000679A324|nr:hypothetical protein [Halanaeroarchaeum sulfurireducens]